MPGDGTPVETAEEVDRPAADSPQGNDEDEGATPSESKKGGEEETSRKTDGGEDEPEFELEGFKRLDDGQYELTLGNSVYLGKTPEEAWGKARAAEAEKDRAFREMKAKSAFRRPDGREEGAEIPKPPSEQEIVLRIAKERGVSLERLFWADNDPRWDAYQDENSLRDRHVMMEQGRIHEVLNQARKEYTEGNRDFLNAMTVDEVYPDVVKQITEAGLDPDSFAGEFEQIIRDAVKEAKNGLVSGSAISTQFAVRIIRELKKQSGPVADERLKKAKEDLKKIRITTGAGGTGGRAPLTPRKTEPVRSLKDGLASAKAALKAGRL